ncbi:unnamed protein product, partial [Iphiclides podalirius]
MTRGCIQGSACGPVLWNIILDELLDIGLPVGCHIQAFADDVLLVATAGSVSELETITNSSLSRIVDWGSSVKLSFGPAKTRMIAFTPKAKTAVITMSGQRLAFSPDLKYLGVVLDEKLLFGRHVRYVIDKARRIFNALCMFSRPTWGAHPENISTIYRQVIEPTVTYAAGIWGHVTHKRCIRRSLESLQRGFAIKAIRGFRTISTTAAVALAQFTPLDLKVRQVHIVERARLSGTCDYVPDDIPLERPTPIHRLLHPAERINIDPKLLPTQDLVDAQIYTDGSKQNDGAVGAAFVCYDNSNTHPKTTKKFRLHNTCTVFQAELFAIHQACLWADTKQYTRTVIATDSLSSIRALQNRSNTHPIITNIHHTIHRIQQSSRIIDIVWVKAHTGILGNEAADTAANSATKLHKKPDYFAIPLSYIKHKIKTDNQSIWQARYESAEQGKHTRNILPTLDHIKSLKATSPT